MDFYTLCLVSLGDRIMVLVFRLMKGKAFPSAALSLRPTPSPGGTQQAAYPLKPLKSSNQSIVPTIKIPEISI